MVSLQPTTSERFIMFFVEEVIVMGTLVEILTHPVLDEVHGREVVMRVVEDIIDDKWLVRLIKVDETGLVVVEERSSYHDDKE
jgi:hypothetical protein